MKRKMLNAVTESTDNTHKIYAKTKQIQDRSQRYVNFMMENPLRKFIPEKKLFNGLSYQEYEREFLLYYNMLKTE